MQKFLSVSASISFCLKLKSQFSGVLLVIISLIYFPGLILAQTQPFGMDKLALEFSGKYGQVEVGGNYVGAEFHHSRPLPTRISFYYPVANSIDLSTDYWKRDESRLFNIVADVDGKVDMVGIQPCIYTWTPYKAEFSEEKNNYHITYSYQFCEDLPMMVIKLEFTNQSASERKFDIKLDFAASLRTCQTYAFKDTADEEYIKHGTVYIANFKYRDTDSAAVFVANAGDIPNARQENNNGSQIAKNPQAMFSYTKVLSPLAKLKIILLIGSCKISEARNVVAKATTSWQKDVRTSEDRILQYVYDGSTISIPDSNLEQTSYWSKAALAADRHFINGAIVPMPCPAEYNFFFTHDALLTDLGAVFFDLHRVKHDLLFIKSLTRSDSILPHAYYWRDDGFKTEFALADNWNHLWFAILCGTYLKHSDDAGTLESVYPILKKSITMTLSNLGPDGLMYSTRPDWWDVGNNYGARSYLTALMVRALREYSYVALRLHRDNHFARECCKESDTLQEKLLEKFWNTKADYLLDSFDTSAIDHHYYAGPLVAADYNLLDDDKTDTLLQTAQKILLDPKLGVRTAMPADFDKLLGVYKFKQGEVGDPYVYINGAVWTQTTAWYILALINLGKVDLAKECLEKYFSLSGIEKSPNGQPAFFEYRFSDSSSSTYGKIDKPNFMWAAGWYLNSLYHLVGVRENEWNISLNPNIPQGLEDADYGLTCGGELATVSWAGKGKYLRNVSVDGKYFPSTILTGKPKRIEVERGIPLSPYLEGSTCVVEQVSSPAANEIALQVEGFVGQKAILTFVSPRSVKKVSVGTMDLTSKVVSQKTDEVYSITFEFYFDKENENVYLKF